MFISGSDLSGIKGDYSVRLYLLCQNTDAFGKIVEDLSCHEKPNGESLALEDTDEVRGKNFCDLFFA